MAEMMSEKELAEIRGLCEAATPGPWLLSQNLEAVETTQLAPNGDIYGGFLWEPDFDDESHETRLAYLNRDGAFIAASRSAVPRLLAEIERLRALLVDATEIIDTIHLTDSDDSIGSVKVDTSHGRNYLPYTAKAWLADLAKATP